MADKVRSNSTFQMIAGTFLILFSAPCIAASISDLVTGAHNGKGSLILGVFFSISLLIGIGLGWLGWGSRNAGMPKHGVTEQQEAAALRMIQDLGGVVTVAQLAMNTQLSVTRATDFLRQLEIDGVVHSWITDDGAIAYKLPGVGPSADDVVFDLEEQPQVQSVNAEHKH